jgi:hypothetical protein
LDGDAFTPPIALIITMARTCPPRYTGAGSAASLERRHRSPTEGVPSRIDDPEPNVTASVRRR